MKPRGGVAFLLFLVHCALEADNRTWVFRFHLSAADRVVDFAAEER